MNHLLFSFCVYGASILKLQKQVVRIILDLKNDGSAQDMFAELDILTVSSQYKFNCVIRTKQS